MSSKSILAKILAALARAAIRKYNPMIIGVTGSVGKTSTREAIFAVLKDRYKVRQGKKSFNTEIGLPLVIIGMEYYHKNIFKWAGGLLKACFRIFLKKEEYPEILLLEYGIEYPGDMDRLLSIAKPHIAVVTAIGDVPVHVEFFKDPQDVAKEKEKLVRSVSKEGFIVLNHDDYTVFDMREKTEARVFTFGFEDNADVKVSNFQVSTSKDAELGDVPAGVSFKIQYGGNMVPFWIEGGFGMPQAYASAAATGVGISMGMNLVEVSQALRSYTPPAGRMRLIEGIKKSLVLDDSYNAAPKAMTAALETLNMLPAKRKIAVLGDMLEIGTYTEQIHRSIGDRVAQFADLLMVVGIRAKFISSEARARGMEKIMEFEDSLSAGQELKNIIQEGDLILVKGSQSMRMEKTVEEVMAHPELAGTLLVRQEDYWKNSA